MAVNMEGEVGGDVTLLKTSLLDHYIDLARKSSMWYMTFGLACCGIELDPDGRPPR